MSPRDVAAHARWIAPLFGRSLGDLIRGPVRGQVELILAVADHFEPLYAGASPEAARARVAHWVDHYAESLGRFRDADGLPPRHTFFYPIDEYVPEHLEGIAGLCRDGFGEVELHLHHHGDSAETLRRKLLHAAATFSEGHGLLARRKTTGHLGYAFVHGNWALNNARPDGCHCGVNDEIRVLRETGCYADFTFPSAPHPTQPPPLNRPYHAGSDPARPRGHERPLSGPTDQSVFMIPGPLTFDWRRRKWGLVPRVENACLQASQPPGMRRLDRWLGAKVRVAARPDWYFVKLHGHGAPERDREALIGPPARAFHQALADRAAADPGFRVHYVSAREMYNLARAAESGWTGDVNGARDFEYVWGRRPVEPAFVGGGVKFQRPESGKGESTHEY